MVTEHRRVTAIAIVSFSLLFVFLVLRHAGLYPTVFSDEYTYSMTSRLLPLKNAAIPNYLYLKLFRVVNVCGPEFLGCARFLNVLSFLLAAPFIYLVGRRFVGRGLAIFIALMAVAGPINTYAAYFMPESLYFLSFWAATWSILRIEHRDSIGEWCFSGMVFGLSALVKPHTLFLIPALVIYISYSRVRAGNGIRSVIAKACAFVAALLLTKLVLGVAIGGNKGFTLFGPLYSSIAPSASSAVDRLFQLAGMALHNAEGHVLALCLMYGLALLCVLKAAFGNVRSPGYPAPAERVSIYCFVVFLVLVPITALFTASVSGSGPLESVARVHMRYYNFAIPLLFLAVAAELQANVVFRERRGQVWLVLGTACIAILMWYAGTSGLKGFTPSMVDSPELRSYMFTRRESHWLGFLSLVSLLAWVIRPSIGAKLFLFFYLPIMVVVSAVYIGRDLDMRRVANVYDDAGIFAHRALSPADASHLVVVGSDEVGTLRTLFHVDSAGATRLIVPARETLSRASLPDGREWALVVGDHEFLDPDITQQHVMGFSLVRLSAARTLNFKMASWPGIVDTVSGLSYPEAWGTWSDSATIDINFSSALPQRFTVRILARAFATNVGKPFEVRIGNEVKTILLGDSAKDHVLTFDNPTRENKLQIVVPQPISAVDVGLNDIDHRKLGIGLVSVKIDPAK